MMSAAVAGAVGFGVGGVVAARTSESVQSYYACLSPQGNLSQVGTIAPTCQGAGTVINFGGGMSLPSGDAFVNGVLVEPYAQIPKAYFRDQDLSHST
jgi:hypothetical protein